MEGAIKKIVKDPDKLQKKRAKRGLPVLMEKDHGGALQFRYRQIHPRRKRRLRSVTVL